MGDTVTASGRHRADHRRAARAQPLLRRPTLWVTFDGYLGALARRPTPTPPPCCRGHGRHPGRGHDPAELAARPSTTRSTGCRRSTRSQAVDEAAGRVVGEHLVPADPPLAFLVVAVVIGFFFLILTVQKQSTLTVLRAVGAPSRLPSWTLLKQISPGRGRLGLIVGLLLFGAGGAPRPGSPISLQPDR